MNGPATSLPRLAAAIAVLALGARTAGAQYTTVPAAAAYALTGVTVVDASGRRTPGLTIVVRDGLIASMAAGGAVPAGAQRLEGDSLVVYPGLVDGQGTAKFKFPDVDIDRAQVKSWDPPRVLQGFTPHRRVVDVLQATGTDVASQRQQGIVAEAVHPDAALMAGQGTVLLLRPGASSPAELVVTPTAGVLFGLRGGRGVYPGTLFGTTAFLRQALEDAKRDRAVAAIYARDPKGMVRPPADPDYAVLERVVAGDERVFFVANTPSEISYAVRLGEQYGFVPVIVGGMEAWKVAPMLAQKKVPVLVSVDFPKARRWKPAATADTGKSASPLDAEMQREKEDTEAAYANAGKLATAGVRFALTTGGGKANLREGTRTAIEYGLSEADALRATTSTPAELLGIPRVTTLAPGTPATFVVTDGPLFGKDTRVVYTMVEGDLEKGRTSSATPRSGAAAAGGAAGAVAGTWSLDLESAQGSLSGTMTLTGTPEAFSGSIDTEMGAFPVKGGKVNGQAVTFTVVFTMMQNAEVPFTGTLQNGELHATASTPMGEVKVSGKRSPGARTADEEDDIDYQLLWEGHSHSAAPHVRSPGGNGTGSQTENN